MNLEIVDKIVNSLIYEGYLLYPYRESAMKNRHRWNFGIVYPVGIEPSKMKTECLVSGESTTRLQITVRFLQISMAGRGQKAAEQTMEMHSRLGENETTGNFAFQDIEVAVEIAATPIAERLYRVCVQISNQTLCEVSGKNHDEILLQSLVSTHTLLNVEGGEFISLLDPPEEFKVHVSHCTNVGTWPVLIGREPDRNCMLSSPIILYDYPHIAPESPGALFDSTEIDEILTLRILTLTEDEKQEIRNGDDRGRRVLEHVESLTPEQLLRLHGKIKEVPLDVHLKPGDRVRLNPKPGGDAMDIVLAGRVAIVDSVEQDFEDRIHVAVVIEDDPGKDLGKMGQPGHRFFFSVDEVELLL